jgi:O-antigen/teichoic acid export membrane protein
MAGGSNDSLITYSKYYKTTTLLLIMLCVLVVALNFIFIPEFGMTGAAFASFLALLIYNVLKMLFIHRKFALNPYTIQYIYILGIAALIYAIVSNLPYTAHFIIEIGIDSSLTILLFYFSIKNFAIAKDLNKAATQIYQKVIGFLR